RPGTPWIGPKLFISMDAGDVLIVDDNPDNLALLAGMLRASGHRVRLASTGARALEISRVHPPDLVMLDVSMPEMDGYTLCERLKADDTTRPIPVIFLSALDDPLDKVRAFQAGGVDYVTKPFAPEEVLARVATQLRVSRLQRETDEKARALERANQQILRLSA